MYGAVRIFTLVFRVLADAVPPEPLHIFGGYVHR